MSQARNRTGDRTIRNALPNEDRSTVEATAPEATTGDDTVDEDISRRRALKLGAAGLLAAGAGALAFGSKPQEAQAANGDPLTLGQANTSSRETSLTSAASIALKVMANGQNAIMALNNSDDGFAVNAHSGGFDSTIIGSNDGYGAGVEARSEHGSALYAKTQAPSGYAVEAHAKSTGPTIYVANEGTGPGIQGLTTQGAGVEGLSGSGPGVRGIGNASSAGVLDESTKGGPALEVKGPAKFDGAVEFAGGAIKFSQPVEFQASIQLSGLAGTATIPKSKTSVKVANASITGQSVIILSPVGNPASVLGGLLSTAFWYERQPGSGFVIYLSLPAKQSVEFAYFIAKM